MVEAKLLVNVCWLTVWPARAEETASLMLGVRVTMICCTRLPSLELEPLLLEKLLCCPTNLLLLEEELRALATALWMSGLRAERTLLTMEPEFTLLDEENLLLPVNLIIYRLSMIIFIYWMYACLPCV